MMRWYGVELPQHDTSNDECFWSKTIGKICLKELEKKLNLKMSWKFETEPN